MHVKADRFPVSPLLWCVLSALVVFLSIGCATTVDKDIVKKANFHYQLGNNHFHAGEVPQAIRELDVALKYQPEHVEALHLMGFIFMGRQQYPEAVRYLKQTLELRPDFYMGQNNLGVVMMHMERWSEAADIFDALTKNPLYTSPWLAYANLGWAHYKMGYVAKGIEQTKMALFLNPKMCLASNNLGIMYAEQGLWDQAELSLQEAIEGCEKYAEPHLHLGRLMAERGAHRPAVDHFRRCVELSPRSHLGQRCRQYLVAVQ